MTTPATPANWPQRPVSAEGTDLAAPLGSLADSLRLLDPQKTDPKYFGLIESTTLELTSQIKKWITFGGGSAAVLGTAGSVTSALLKKPAIAVAAILAVAIISAAAFLALAWVMNGDVRGRAAATTEQVRVRGVLASSFLEHAGPNALAFGPEGDQTVQLLQQILSEVQKAKG